MRLQEFVSQTLSEIISGIVAAQSTDAVKDSTGAIVPKGQGVYDAEIRNQSVEFDVMVTIESGTETKGGIGVLLPVVSLGSTGQSTDTNQAVNRIRFTVPIFLPNGKPINRCQ